MGPAAVNMGGPSRRLQIFDHAHSLFAFRALYCKFQMYEYIVATRARIDAAELATIHGRYFRLVNSIWSVIRSENTPTILVKEGGGGGGGGVRGKLASNPGAEVEEGVSTVCACA